MKNKGRKREEATKLNKEEEGEEEGKNEKQ